MTFHLSQRSHERLCGVHPRLARVVRQAILITNVDFTVLEGRRTLTRQQVLFDSGATTTMNSRHLSGHAVDLGAWVHGEVRWDWPLYQQISMAMKKAAKKQEVPIEWGGDWHTFKDGPHFQLPWKDYPA